VRVVAALLLLTAAVVAESRVRASVKPAAGARVGEPVTLAVELMTTKWFKSGARLPELDVPGAVVRRLSKFGINGTATVDGVDYTTQTWEYTIYPQRAGRFDVPPLTVRMYPADAERAVDATTETVRFEIAALPGEAACAAQALDASQVFLPQEGPYEVGHAVTRTITLRSTGAPGMLLPPLGATDADGWTAYPKTPRVDDKIQRGEITGTRIESVTYVFERPGTYRLPEIRIPWWNIAAKRLETVTLTGLEIVVAPSAETAVAPPPPERSFPWWLLGLVAALAGAAWLAVKLRASWAVSEAATFRAVTHANGAQATYRALGAWLSRTNLRPDAALRRELDALGDHLYGHGGPWDPVALRRAARAIRRRRAQRPRAGLPPLNP